MDDGSERDVDGDYKPNILIDEDNNSLVDRKMCEFRVHEAIGRSTSYGISIYRGERGDPSFPPSPMVSVVYLHRDRDAALVSNLRSRRWDYEYTLRPCSVFYYKQYYCLVFGYKEQGSLISFMARRFPAGFPEKCILFILFRALSGLANIHRDNQLHGQISAAHIYVSQTWGELLPALGYASSVVDLFADQIRDSHSPYMPATSVCRWAAAPAPPSNKPSNSNSKADDIWAIGITALELAYGGLRLAGRADLDSLVKKIHRKNKLPKKLNDVVHHHHSISTSIRRRVADPSFLEYVPKERCFSKGFVDFVRSCLRLRPDKRPTAEQLLRHPLFIKATFRLDVFFLPY